MDFLLYRFISSSKGLVKDKVKVEKLICAAYLHSLLTSWDNVFLFSLFQRFHVVTTLYTRNATKFQTQRDELRL